MEIVIERRAKGLARILAIVALLIGSLVLIGHLFGWPLLIRPAPSAQGTAPLSAVAIVCLSLAVVFAIRERDKAVHVALLLPIVVAAVVLAGYGLRNADVLHPWLTAGVFGTGADFVARMSPATAFTLLMVAVAIATRRRAGWADSSGGCALLVSGTALLGFAYGVDDLFLRSFFATMGSYTAIALVLLSAATLFLEPARGWSSVILSRYFAGGATRRQLALLLLPVVVGWFLHRATMAQQMGSASAFALLVTLTFASMALLVLRDGRALLALEAERRTHADAQKALAIDLEHRLVHKAAQLEHESSERSKMEAALLRTQRVEAIGQLTGGIAHDFNNLLAAIGGNLELLLRKLPEDHGARRHAVTAANAVGKGAKLAGQLLAFSRSQRLAIESIEVAPALRRARALIGSSLGPSIDVLLEYSGDPLWARTDPDQLELALFNLAVNARDAMPRGGQLRIESGSRTTRLAGDDSDRAYVSIRVIDDGTGMTPEVVSKAIEPFFTTRERGRGSGLGLAQVYGFVRQCEGDLLIDSEPGRGTTVEILLPRGEAPPLRPDGTDASRPAATIGSGPRRRLLVVDDDDAVRGVLVELLTESGYDVVEANDGASALESLAAVAPDGAVIDFLMPGIDGAEVARRARAILPRLPVVFVSGYSETVELESVRDAVVLRKPFEGAQLQAAVEEAFASVS